MTDEDAKDLSEQLFDAVAFHDELLFGKDDWYLTPEPDEDVPSYLEPADTIWFLPKDVPVIWWNPEDWRVIYGKQADA